MKIIISGSTGFIGNNLSNYLADKGHNIIRLVRKTSKNISRNFETHLWDPDNHYLPDKPFIGSDAVIHLGGRKIISLRWTKKIKNEDNVTIRTKESLYYYELYKENFKIPEYDNEKKLCSDCNAEIISNSKFCRMCGKFPI